MSKNTIKLKSSQKEQIPIGGKLYYHDFDPQLIRQACLEYWKIHNFNWSSYTFPSLKFKPSTAKEFLSKDYPQDMSDVLSLNAFGELYQSIQTLPESECCSKIQRFSIVVCSIGETMYLLKSWFGLKDTTVEEHLETAIDCVLAL
ncbi:hypothetical protein H6G64_35080 [Calothrix sp. FACHB-156]|nr:hypothetical protein [Calothrix sp. FACHB-156]